MSLADRKNASTVNKVVKREQVVFMGGKYMKMFISNHLNHVNHGYGRKSGGRDYNDKKVKTGIRTEAIVVVMRSKTSFTGPALGGEIRDGNGVSEE